MKTCLALAFLNLIGATAWAGPCVNERDLSKLREAERRLEERLIEILKSPQQTRDWRKIAESANVARATTIAIGDSPTHRRLSALWVDAKDIGRLHEMSSLRLTAAYYDYHRESAALIYDCETSPKPTTDATKSTPPEMLAKANR